MERILRGETVSSPDRKSFSDSAKRMMSALRSKSQRTMASMKSRVGAMRNNPAVLGGLATAAGLAVGIAGRYLRHRAHAARVIVIEAI